MITPYSNIISVTTLEALLLDTYSGAAAADYKGYPVPGGETLYWVNFQYSELDGFYYIEYVQDLEKSLGEPIEFDVTFPDFEL